MSGQSGMLRQPQMVGVACALAATCLGIVYLIAAGAPASRSFVNGVAFLLGVVAIVGVGGAMTHIARFLEPVLLVMGFALLVTALLGAPADGASRWLMLGPLSVQVSLVLLPFMAVIFAARKTWQGCLAVAVAALALAIQPDRGMAGVLALSMAVLAITKPSGLTVSALIASVAAFCVTMIRSDTLPAVPYVDQILFTAFDVHIFVGVAVWCGALLLLVPPIVRWRRDRRACSPHLVFAAIWLGCIVAAALGNYPTPVVGYGGSAIFGYLLALSALSPACGLASEAIDAAADDDQTRINERYRRALLA